MYCETDSKYEYIWLSEDDPVPTTCPTNTSHTITSNSARIVEIRDPNIVNIGQETTKTGGHYRLDSVQFTAVKNTTTTHTFSYPIDITVISAEWQTASENTGDIVSWKISKDTTIGVITSDVNVGDTTINVSSTVIDNIKVGFLVNLFDGVTENELGIVISIDTDNETITVQTATTDSFLLSTPTYVRITIPFLLDVELGHPTRMMIGESKIMGSFVPANTVVTCEYTNMSTTDDKRITTIVEFLY